eukprot:757669-Hanusia_phi.AAC.5
MLRGSLLLLLLASAAANSLVHPHISALGRLSLTKASSTNMRLRGGEPDIFKVTTKPTTPFSGQKPGTSGLHAKGLNALCLRAHSQHRTAQEDSQCITMYAECVQHPCRPEGSHRGAMSCLSEDGRYFNREAIQIIAKIAVAAGVERLMARLFDSQSLTRCPSDCGSGRMVSSPPPRYLALSIPVRRFDLSAGLGCPPQP